MEFFGRCLVELPQTIFLFRKVHLRSFWQKWVKFPQNLEFMLSQGSVDDSLEEKKYHECYRRFLSSNSRFFYADKKIWKKSFLIKKKRWKALNNLMKTLDHVLVDSTKSSCEISSWWFKFPRYYWWKKCYKEIKKKSLHHSEECTTKNHQKTMAEKNFVNLVNC